MGTSCMVQYSVAHQIYHHNRRHCTKCMAAAPQAFPWCASDTAPYTSFWQCRALVVQLHWEQFPIGLCLRQNAMSVSVLLRCLDNIAVKTETFVSVFASVFVFVFECSVFVLLLCITLTTESCQHSKHTMGGFMFYVCKLRFREGWVV